MAVSNPLLGVALAALAAIVIAACDVGSTSRHTTSGDGGEASTSEAAGPATGAGGDDVTSGPATSGAGGGSGHPMAPNGYYVEGNSIYDANGKAHLLHGVARPSLEWSTMGEHVSLADFQAMKGWGARVARLALNQDFWLPNAAKHDGAYPGNVDQAIQWAHQAGLDVILDLHWSDRGDLGNQGPGQQRMA